MSGSGTPSDGGSARLRGITKKYRATTALAGVDLDLSPGVTALLGRNGAGKSTLVRLLVGVEKPDEGEIQADGIGDSTYSRTFRRQVGWLPQSFGFPRSMKTKGFVSYAAWLKEVDEKPAEAASRAMAFANVTDVADRPLGSLSGGTLRRVGLAAAVAHRPRLLVLDEPTTGLDPIQRADLHERVAELAEHCTVLLATHILEDVTALAHRISVLDGGKLIWEGDRRGLGALGGTGGDSVDDLRSGFSKLVGGAEL